MENMTGVMVTVGEVSPGKGGVAIPGGSPMLGSPYTGWAGDLLLMFLGPLLLLTGSLGNLASFAVMMTRELRRQSTSVYLSTLAVFDTAQLCQLFWAYWYGMFGDVSPGSRPDWACKLEIITLRFQATVTAYLVVAVSVERLLVTFIPLHVASICTVRNARFVTAAILVLTLTYALGAVLQFGVSTGPCDLRDYMYYFNEAQTKWLLPTLYSIVPSVTLFVVSSAISLRLLLKKNIAITSKSDRNALRATKVVLLVSFTYLTLTVPATAGMTLLRKAFLTQTISAGSLILFRGSVILLMTNHGINLFLYILISPRFRGKFIELFCCCAWAVSPPSSLSGSLNKGVSFKSKK